MTSGWNRRARLLACVMLLVSGSHLKASETHDSCYLCGWTDSEPKPAELESAKAEPETVIADLEPENVDLDSLPADQKDPRLAPCGSRDFVEVAPVEAETAPEELDVVAESSEPRANVEDEATTVSEPAIAKLETPFEPTEESSSGQTFFRIQNADGLTITTCDYDEWLAWQLESAGWEPEPTAEEVAARQLIEATVSAISSVATIGKEVRFGQWIEPFAMIGPQDGHSVEQIEAFLQWFANERPIEMPLENIIDRLVGSSPIITTIEEAYAPYDIHVGKGPSEADDYVTWNDGMFVSQNQPFCIHACLKVREPGWGPIGLSDGGRAASPVQLDSPVDAGVTNRSVVQWQESLEEAGAEIAVGSPECLTDEWLWQTGLAWREAKKTGEGLRPEMIGSKVALVVVKCDECLEIAADRLALVWPKEKRRAKPIDGVGAKLLARAEVAEQGDSNDGAVNTSDEAKLAQATAILMQWVDAAQKIVDDAAIRWHGVPEVARNRGAQNDSQNR